MSAVRAPLVLVSLVLVSLTLSGCEPVQPIGSGAATQAPVPPAATESAAPPTMSSSTGSAPPSTPAPAPSQAPSSAPAAPTSVLPFDLPGAQTLRASTKLVFAHYFTPYPVSLDNAPPASDYYTQQYLTPGGEGGKFMATGGLLRQRPLPREPISGDYRLEDLKTEVRRASAAGLDGFTVDILEYSGRNWDAVVNLTKAAEQVDPGFKIMLMPDMTSLPADQAALTKAITTLATSPSVFRLADHRLVIAPFAPERQPVTWWAQWLDSLRAAGTATAFVPVFVDFSQLEQFEPISYGLSTWGNRNPADNQNIGSVSAFARSKGKLWMQAVSAQDERPSSGVYAEALNTENLRATWAGAIANGAQWVQIPTWNDYSEGTEIAPSTHTGYVFLDLCSYYLTWFKTGSAPPVRRDVAYLTHRVQFTTMKPTSQTTLMRLTGGSPPRDAAEVLTFLTAPATVTVTIGGATSSYQAAAGITARLFPLGAGTAAVRLTRGSAELGAVTSPFPVRSSAPIQDLQYYAVSTSRQP